MALGCALAQPLAITHNHVIGLALGGELGKHAVAKRRPWLLHHLDIYTRNALVILHQLL